MFKKSERKKNIAYILDNDGTLLKFEESIPKSKETLTHFIEHNIPFVILSNTGEKTSKQLIEKVENVVGLKIPLCHGLTAMDHLCEIINKSCRFRYIKIVSKLPLSAFEMHFKDLSCQISKFDHNIDERDLNDKNETVIVLFSDGTVDNFVETITSISMYMIKGATLYATSYDLTISKRFMGLECDYPGPGMILEGIKLLLKNKHSSCINNIHVFGKGSQQNSFTQKAIDMLISQGFDGQYQDIRFVGDRFDTDIRAGCNMGIRTILVETGCHRSEDQYQFPEDVADFVASSLNEIVSCQESNIFQTQQKLHNLFKKITRYVLNKSYNTNKLIDKLLKDLDSLFSQPQRIKSCNDIASLNK